MRVITSQALLTKYNLTSDQATAMLSPLSPNVDILPDANCYAAKSHIDSINDSIVIVGGHDIIQFFTLANPCNDPDQTVTSDAPYACTSDPLFYTPNKIVSRIPDEMSNPKLEYLQTVIDSQVAHMAGIPSTSGWFNIVAQVWQGISSFMSQQFAMNNQNTAPMSAPGPIQDVQILGKKFHYLNLHGTTQTPYYYGQSGNTYPVALQPTAGHFKDGVVFTEACYGGYLNGRNRMSSIPLMAMYSGAVSVVASSAVAYGPASPPPDGADMLSMCFYHRLTSGHSIGESFMLAKQDFITNLIQRDGNLEPSNRKTLLEFMVFGSADIKV